MKRICFLLSLLAVGAVSCVKEAPESMQYPTTGSEFYACIEAPGSPATKVYADPQLRVLWDADDRVSIFNHYTYNQEYAFEGKTGENAGSFKMIDKGKFVTGNTLDLVYAVYPYQEETRIDNDGILSVRLPARQTYRDHSFGPGSNTMISCTTGNQLLFKNLCGYLSIELYGEGLAVSGISLRGNDGESLAGPAHVFSSLEGTPSLSFEDSATGEITVDINPPVKLGASASEAIAFWLVIPPVTFAQGFTVTITDDKGSVFEKATSKPLSIARNTLSRMEPLEVDIAGYYIDEYGINYGSGVTIDGITWAPVNCGYKPATEDSKGYPYGKLYQWGRKYGQGYGAPYYNSSDTYEDETLPTFQSYWTGTNESAEKNTYYYGSEGSSYNWIQSGENFWNAGTEDAPKKNALYDPCPKGWRVPTEAELSALFGGNHSNLLMHEGVYGVWASGSVAYEENLQQKLFLPAGGSRFADNWFHQCKALGRGTGWQYWSSSLRNSNAVLASEWGSKDLGDTYRAFGNTIRCCRDTASSTPVVPPEVPDDPQYDWDGEVVTLQSGSPNLNVIILGDGFIKDDFDDGTYDTIMRQLYADFFSIEPYTTLQSGFSVYYVKAPSPQRMNATTTGANGAENGDAKTKFSVQFTPNSTRVSGDDSLVKEYAKKALGQNANQLIENATILVVANQRCRAGTNYSSSVSSGDYGRACSIAYFGLGQNDAERTQLVHHEACGHGFGLLDDEYSSAWISRMSTLEWSKLDIRHQYGISRNTDKYVSESVYEQLSGSSYQITTKNTVYWAALFNTDNHYESEEVESLGVYEGAHTYYNFFCRPTQNGSRSIMNMNTGIFNAPSRRQIYYRYLRLTGQVTEDQFGSEEELNRFLTWDASLLPELKAKTSATKEQPRTLLEEVLPLASPVICSGEWIDGRFVPMDDEKFESLTASEKPW